MNEEMGEEKLIDLVDARGVEIEPGDVVIYSSMVNHPLGRRIVMAEGVVLGDPICPDCEQVRPPLNLVHQCHTDPTGRPAPPPTQVSLTPSGRVRIRPCGGVQKPVVDAGTDRLVVLKFFSGARPGASVQPYLPMSSLKNQEKRGD